MITVPRKRADNLKSDPAGGYDARSRQLLAALCPPGASGGLVVAELLPRRELALPLLAVPAPGAAAPPDPAFVAFAEPPTARALAGTGWLCVSARLGCADAPCRVQVRALPHPGRRRRILVLLPSPGAAPDAAPPKPRPLGARRQAELITALDLYERYEIEPLVAHLAQRTRHVFLKTLSLRDTLTAFLRDFGSRAGLDVLRLFLVGENTGIKPVFAGWDRVAPENPEPVHEVFRRLMQDDPQAAVVGDGPIRLPHDLSGCFFRLEAGRYRFYFLGAAAARSGRTDPGFLLHACLRQLAMLFDETAPLLPRIEGVLQQKETTQLLLRIMALGDLEQFRRELPALLQEFLHVESVAYYFYQPDNRRLNRHAFAGSFGELLPDRESCDLDTYTWLTRCAKSGNTLLKTDLTASERKQVTENGLFASVLYYPVDTGEAARDVVLAADTRRDRVTFQHVQRLNQIQPFLTQAIRNNRLYSGIQRHLYVDFDTNLPNRRGFEEALQICLERSKRVGDSFTVIMASLDRPDRINLRTYGDSPRAFLLKLCAFFQKQLPPQATLAYSGEFKFLFLLPRYEMEPSLELARRLCLQARETLRDAENRPTFSLGISCFPINGMSLDDLLLSAEQAMTMSRFQGGDTASLMGSQLIKKLALNVFSQFMGQGTLRTGPEVVDGVLQKISDRREVDESLTTVEMINSLAEAIDAKDHYTSNHTLETSILAVALGRLMVLDDETLERLRIAAKLHDIGKIGVPEHILLKQGKLTADEELVMRRHAEIGARILRPISSLRHIAVIVEHHHERWDGSGYPHGLRGEEIPIESRILAVIDAYHAMVSHRTYRESQTLEFALGEIRRGAGGQFDPRVTELFGQMMAERRELGAMAPFADWPLRPDQPPM